MDKSPEAFRTISEVAEALETPAHVLRFWESRFPQIRPVKRAGGRRYYRPADVALLTGIKRLLHDEGMTIRGVQKILREQGIRHVAGLSDEASPEEMALGEAMVSQFDAEADAPVAEEAEETAAALEAALEPLAFPAPVAVAEGTIVPAHSIDEAEASIPSALDWIVSAQQDRNLAVPVQPSLQLETTEQTVDDTVATLAARLRALPAGSLGQKQEELAAIAARISALRMRLSGQMPPR